MDEWWRLDASSLGGREGAGPGERDRSPERKQHGSRDSYTAAITLPRESETDKSSDDLVVPPRPSHPPSPPEEGTGPHVSNGVDEEEETVPIRVSPKGDPSLGEKPKEDSSGGNLGGGNLRERLNKGTEKVWRNTSSAREKAGSARDILHPKRPEGKCFLWAIGISWVVSPSFFVALYDHALLFLDTPRGFPRSPYLATGGAPAGWGIMEGPGRWVRDTFGMSWEQESTHKFIVSAVLGILPLILMDLGAYVEQRWVPQVGRLFVWVVGAGTASYIAFAWDPFWWEVYLTTLFSAAWYCTKVAKTKEIGTQMVILFIPAASLFSGMIAYSPGAAF